MNQINKAFINFLVIVLANSIYANQTNHVQTIYLGSGCFWGAEKGYEQIEGVIDAESGYANGYGVKPTYRSIIQFKNKFNENNFAEVVKITFNSNALSLEMILKHFFEIEISREREISIKKKTFLKLKLLGKLIIFSH